jgi:hypothetical protein
MDHAPQLPRRPDNPENVRHLREDAERRMDLSELVHERQKVYPLSLLCRKGLLYFQGFAGPRKPGPGTLLKLKNQI